MKKLLMIMVAMVMFACAPALAETCRLDKQDQGWSDGHFTYMCFYSCRSGFTFAISMDGQCPSYYRK